MEKTYKYKDNEYAVILKNGVPLLSQLNLFNELKCDLNDNIRNKTLHIDLNKINKARLRILELETAIQQLDKKNIKQLKKLNDSLKIENEKFEKNTFIYNLWNSYNKINEECTNLWLMDIKQFVPFLEIYLKGDLTKLDYEDLECFKMIAEVITDFFLLSIKLKLL